jgi:coenzyme PQQ synthesis protein D (PqqD)
MSRPDFALAPLRLSPDVVSRSIAGEQILVPVRNGAAQIDYLFTANEVGSMVFGLLDGRRDGLEIARLLTTEFEVSEEQARHDVIEFLAELYEAGLALPAEGRP